MLFFRPSPSFVKWLIAYANGRPIIDVGCGEGELLAKLIAAGCKRCLGIDPFGGDSLIPDPERKHKIPKSVIIPSWVEQTSVIRRPYQLVIACRPDHSGWFNNLPSLLDESSELLYIGLRKNIRTDLDGLTGEYLRLNNVQMRGHVIIKVSGITIGAI